MIAHLQEMGVLWRRVALIAPVAVALPWLTANEASAVSLRVKLACSTDYYAHCSNFPSESPETRACMRALGERLSPRCVNALVAEGEVSPAEVARRAANVRRH